MFGVHDLMRPPPRVTKKAIVSYHHDCEWPTRGLDVRIRVNVLKMGSFILPNSCECMLEL